MWATKYMHKIMNYFTAYFSCITYSLLAYFQKIQWFKEDIYNTVKNTMYTNSLVEITWFCSYFRRL